MIIDVVDSSSLDPALREDILSLCAVAYGEDLAPLFTAYGAGTHVVGTIGGALVSHAMWVTRWLQPGPRPPLRTAYVEAVATHPDHRRRGYASALLGRLADEIPDEYEMAALAPATLGIYERLGWRAWRGPLAIRRPDGSIEPTPDETVMVLDLPGRAVLDLDAPLSAEWRGGEVW